VSCVGLESEALARLVQKRAARPRSKSEGALRWRGIDEYSDYLPSGRLVPPGFSLQAARKRLFAAQIEEYALMEKRRVATERREKFGPRLEQKLRRVREHIDAIRNEMLLLDEQAQRDA
jgi:hypothetical protein